MERSTVVITSLWENPYVGPRTFETKEKDFFFGRTREAMDLLSLVISERLVLFYAQSGAGKSSLINTKLIPSLIDEGEYKTLPVGRLLGDASKGNEVKNIYIHNLISSLTKRGIDRSVLSRLTLSEFLAGLDFDDKDGYFYNENTPREFTESDDDTVWKHVLIIDQFEELFTYYQEEWEKREDFFKQLAQAMQDFPYLWIVLVMREDYIAYLDPYAYLLPGRLRVRYYMQRLGQDAAIEAVEGPAGKRQRSYAEGVAKKLVQDLSSIKVRNTEKTWETQTGQFVEPVQLQVVCSRLWEKLPTDKIIITTKDLKLHIGDINSALGNYYEERVKTVAETQRTQEKGINERVIRNWFGRELITLGGIRGMVLREPNGKSGSLDDEIVQKFQGDLVRAEKRGDATWYELTHDRLVEPILECNKEWFEKNSSLLQKQTALWVAQGRPDGMLLRGKELELAELDQKKRESESRTIPKDELDFLTACLRARDRERREKRGNLWLRILAMGMAIALIATFYFAYQTNQAQVQTNQANATNTSQAAIVETAQTAIGGLQQVNEQKIALEKASDLANKARTSLDDLKSRKLGRLLAVEAFMINEPVGGISPIVYQALFESAGLGNDISMGGLFLFGAFNPDPNTNWLIVDNRLWNVEDIQQYHLVDTGKVVQGTFRSNGEVVIVTDNANSLLAGQSPYTAYIRDTKNQIIGQLPLTLPQSAYVATDISLSGDGNWVLLGYGLKPNSDSLPDISTGGIQLWDIQNLSARPKRLSVQDSTKVLTVAVAYDGKKFAVVDDLNRLYLWTNDKLDTFQFLGIDALNIDTNLDDGFINGVYLGTSGKGLQFSPDGRWLAVLTEQNIQIFDTNNTFKLQTRIPVPNYTVVTGYVFSPDNNYLIYSTNNYTDCLDFFYNYLGNYEYLSYDDYYSYSDYLNCSPVTSVYRRPLSDPNPRSSPIFKDNTSEITAMNISKGGWLVIGDKAGYVRMADLSEDINVLPYVTNAHDGKVVNILIGPDNTKVLSTGENDGTRLWEIKESGQQVAITSTRTFNTTTQVIRNKGQGDNLLIVGGFNTANDMAAIQIYSNMQDPLSLSELRFDSVESGGLDALAFSENWVVAGRTDQTFYSNSALSFLDIWDRTSTVSDPKPITFALNSRVSSLTFDQTGTMLAIAMAGGDIWLDTLTGLDSRWRASSQPTPAGSVSDVSNATPQFLPQKKLDNTLKDVRSLAFAQNGNYLIVAGTTGIHLWDMSDFQEYEFQNAIYPVNISGDQKWLATAGLDGSVRLYDLKNIHSSPRVIPNNIPVTQYAFSDDGKWLAVAINTGKVLIYDLPISGFPVLPVYILNGSISDDTQFEFSPSQSAGKWLVASGGAIVYLWNMENPQDDPVVLQGHTGRVMYAGFTQDGKQIITAATDQTLRFWSMDPKKLASAACAYAERNLSPKEWKDYLTGTIRETCPGLGYGLTTEELAIGSSPTPYATIKPFQIPTTTPTLTPTPVGDSINYTIQASDTLSGIAIKFGIDLETLIKDNNIKDRNIIVPGQILKIRVVATTVTSAP